MRRHIFSFTTFLICCLIPGILHAADLNQIALHARVSENYGKLPLAFVENIGQIDAQVRYLIHEPGASLFFRNDGVTFDIWEASTTWNVIASNQRKDPLKQFDIPNFTNTSETHIPGILIDDELFQPKVRKHAVLKLTFEGADPNCRVEGTDKLPGKINYLARNDSSKQYTNIRSFKSIVYKNVWPGIDVVYRGNNHRWRYIRVNPGADLKKIRLKYEGAEKIWLDKSGNLHIQTAVETLQAKISGIYQERNGKQVAIKGGYVLLNAQTVGFRIDGYDSSIPLSIYQMSDLIYSTYMGGINTDCASSITIDSSGCAYVAGATSHSDYPTTIGAHQTKYKGGSYDAFVTKLNASGNGIIFSTFLGGSGNDYVNSITVDPSGCIYVVGNTSSTDFPTTAGAFQKTSKGGDKSFVTKLNASGSALEYSTYLGGSGNDDANPIAIDASGCAYVTGWTSSPDFPTTAGAFQTTLEGDYDAFVTKLNASGSGLAYSTFLGGGDWEAADSITVDASGCAYVSGETYSLDFPVTTGAFQTKLQGGYDAFIAKFNASGSDLVYSTFLGGGGNDYTNPIAVDTSGCVYVTGATSSPDFPTTAGAFQTTLEGGCDAFVTKFNASGNNLIFSTFLGGNNLDLADSITVDSSGYTYVAGVTYSSNFPTTTGAFQTTFFGNGDAFLTKLNASGSTVIYSTFLGGVDYDHASCIAVDSSGCAYVSGETYSSDFPTTDGAFKTTCEDGDIFLSKLSTPSVLVSITSPTTAPSFATTFPTIDISGTVLTSTDVTGVTWNNDRGGGGICSGKTSWSKIGIGLQPGQNIITVTATDATGNTGTATLKVTYAELRIIRVLISSLASTYNPSKSTINIVCHTSDDLGTTSVTWSNDRGGNGICTYNNSWNASGILLQPGVNTITLTVIDIAGNKESVSFRIVR